MSEAYATYRFVPPTAADDRLYNYGPRSWWPAHEIGHFLVATKAECHLYMYGLDNFIKSTCTPSQYHYVVAREIAATSISQRMLRRAGHVAIADEEIEYTDEDTIECSYERWCKRAVRGLLRRNRVLHLPTSYVHIEALLTRKAHEVGTKFYASRRAAIDGAWAHRP